MTVLDTSHSRKAISRRVQFVFQPVSQSKRSDMAKRLCANAKPPLRDSITLHGFRHAYASRLLSRNVSILALSKVLGHANASESLDTHSHLMPGEDFDKIRNVLG